MTCAGEHIAAGAGNSTVTLNMTTPQRVGWIGRGFMGKARSNA